MGGNRRPRPRRAGRKVQIKRLWRSFSLPPRVPITTFEDGIPAESITEAGYDPINPVPWRLVPIDLGPSKLRVRRVEVFTTRIRIVEWRLRRIDIPPVVYPADVPVIDPRYEVYIRKRSEALYPVDPNNNFVEPGTAD